MDFPSKLLIFLEVVEQGSFIKVAELRNVDRSVISRHISSLEDELQVRLFNRTTRSLSVTDAGKEMAQYARNLRQLVDDAKSTAENYHSEPRGTLRITSSGFLGRRYLHKAVDSFRKKYPLVQIEIRLEERLIDLVGEGFDLGLRLGRPKDSRLVGQKLATNKILIVAAPSLIEKHGMPTTIDELSTLPAVTYSHEGISNDHVSVLSEGKVTQVPLNPVYQVSDMEMLMDAAASGIGIAVITGYMVQNELLEGQLLHLMPDLKLPDFGDLYVVYPHRDAPPKIKLFIEEVKKTIGSPIPNWEHRIPSFN